MPLRTGDAETGVALLLMLLLLHKALFDVGYPKEVPSNECCPLDLAA